MGTLSDHVHIYVDASFEDGGYSRLGGALYDSKWNLLSFFSEQLDRTFLDQVKRDGEVSIIQEMEMLALLVAIELWCLEWNGHRVVNFTDSEAVRTSFLKTCSRLLTRVFTLEENHLCPLWIERIPIVNPTPWIVSPGAECPRGKGFTRPT